MHSFFSTIIRGFISIQVFPIISFISYFGFDNSLGSSTLLGLTGSLLTFFTLKWRHKRKFLAEHQLTKKEYAYIQSNLKEAHTKIKRLRKTLVHIRSIQTAKQALKLQQMVLKIYHLVKKEPKRFYQIDQFFFYHLDSIVNLSERYSFLQKQPVKDSKVTKALQETEHMLEKLKNSVEEKYLTILSNDIDEINLDLNVAKLAIDRHENDPKGKEN